MHSSVETRYPFLDEDVFAFLARLHPRWKLRGLKDKYLLRRLGERWLPRSTAWTPKGMFRAPLDSFFTRHPPAYVDQLLSRESLRRTGYFDADAVDSWRRVVGGQWWRGDRSQSHGQYGPGSHKRVSVELGLVAVLATQLWHHQFIDHGLADLPYDWSLPSHDRAVAGREVASVS
jgi:asparagine synthase (glutamine-hydrolysing)